jgi:hypothetical protein
MTASERAAILVIANSIEHQADCLVGYAKSLGFVAKPVPSVFHSQATHFKDQANTLRELIGADD